MAGKHDIYGEDYDVSRRLASWPAGARVELGYADQVPGAVVESAKTIFTRSDDPLAICIGELRQAQEKIRVPADPNRRAGPGPRPQERHRPRS